MSSKSKTLSAVGYASADIFLQVIRENMTSKMVAEAQELSKIRMAWRLFTLSLVRTLMVPVYGERKRSISTAIVMGANAFL